MTKKNIKTKEGNRTGIESQKSFFYQAYGLSSWIFFDTYMFRYEEFIFFMLHKNNVSKSEINKILNSDEMNTFKGITNLIINILTEYNTNIIEGLQSTQDFFQDRRNKHLFWDTFTFHV